VIEWLQPLVGQMQVLREGESAEEYLLWFAKNRFAHLAQVLHPKGHRTQTKTQFQNILNKRRREEAEAAAGGSGLILAGGSMAIAVVFLSISKMLIGKKEEDGAKAAEQSAGGKGKQNKHKKQ
jgi:hypothetical protein